MQTEQKYRVAPAGFTMDQWETFNKDGIIFIEDAISDEDIQTYIDAIDRVAANNPKYTPGGYLGMQNIVERDPAFAGLIDHERHVGPNAFPHRPNARHIFRKIIPADLYLDCAKTLLQVAARLRNQFCGSQLQIDAAGISLRLSRVSTEQFPKRQVLSLAF